MNTRGALLAAVCSLAFVSGSASADAPALDAASRAEVVDALIKQVQAWYVFPDTAEKIGAALRARQQRGGYDAITDAEVLANVLTADLRQAGNDPHLRVTASDTPRPRRFSLFGRLGGEQRKQMAARGFGIAKVEILPGNVGYLDLSSFEPMPDAAPAITAAMSSLADSDALIVDVRGNGGGDAATVAFLSSYLFAQRTHLNDLYWREGNRTVSSWTEGSVPGKRFGQHKPLYVLISQRTFSAAEEFGYNLQQLKRATLVGQTTAGGANPGRMRELTPYFSAFIPNGRAINPITRTNWEGTGVKPDVEAPVAQALAAAHRMALERLAAAAEPQRAAQLREAMPAPEQ